MAAGIHEDFTRHSHHKLPPNRSFAWVMAAAFLFLALWPLKHGAAVRFWLLVPSAIFLVLGIVAPSILTPLNRAWMGLAVLLSRAVNPVIMALLFYGVFTPMGWLMRLMGKDFLRLKRDPRAASYWIARQANVPGSMKHQF